MFSSPSHLFPALKWLFCPPYPTLDASFRQIVSDSTFPATQIFVIFSWVENALFHLCFLAFFLSRFKLLVKQIIAYFSNIRIDHKINVQTGRWGIRDELDDSYDDIMFSDVQYCGNTLKMLMPRFGLLKSPTQTANRTFPVFSSMQLLSRRQHVNDLRFRSLLDSFEFNFNYFIIFVIYLVTYFSAPSEC